MYFYIQKLVRKYLTERELAGQPTDSTRAIRACIYLAVCEYISGRGYAIDPKMGLDFDYEILRIKNHGKQFVFPAHRP